MSDQLQSQVRVVVFPVDIFNVEGLTIHEQMTYIVLQSFTNAHDNTAFPSYETIASKARMSKRQAIRCVNSLIEKGLIIKEERKSHKNPNENTSNMYVIRLPR